MLFLMTEIFCVDGKVQFWRLSINIKTTCGVKAKGQNGIAKRKKGQNGIAGGTKWHSWRDKMA